MHKIYFCHIYLKNETVKSCELLVTKSSASLWDSQKGRKEEEKPWEINLVTQMGSGLACLHVFCFFWVVFPLSFSN